MARAALHLAAATTALAMAMTSCSNGSLPPATEPSSAPWGDLALFYRDGPPASADLLILGHIDADTDELATAQRITIQTVP